MRIAVVAVAAIAIGCGAAVSSVMVPTTAKLSAPPSDRATILFMGNTRGLNATVQTIWDENGTFVGDLAEASAFEHTTSPGRHVFCAAWLEGALTASDMDSKGCNMGQCFTADLAAGKYYVAWWRFKNETPGVLGGWKWRWLFPHPTSKTLTARSAFGEASEIGNVDGVPVFKPDPAKGQAFISHYRPCKAEPSKEPDLPQDWGHDAPPCARRSCPGD
jgi:hypothetical protein